MRFVALLGHLWNTGTPELRSCRAPPRQKSAPVCPRATHTDSKLSPRQEMFDLALIGTDSLCAIKTALHTPELSVSHGTSLASDQWFAGGEDGWWGGSGGHGGEVAANSDFNSGDMWSEDGFIGGSTDKTFLPVPHEAATAGHGADPNSGASAAASHAAANHSGPSILPSDSAGASGSSEGPAGADIGGNAAGGTHTATDNSDYSNGISAARTNDSYTVGDVSSGSQSTANANSYDVSDSTSTGNHAAASAGQGGSGPSGDGYNWDGSARVNATNHHTDTIAQGTDQSDRADSTYITWTWLAEDNSAGAPMEQMGAPVLVPEAVKKLPHKPKLYNDDVLRKLAQQDERWGSMRMKRLFNF